ncbi:MAG TPA: c-type cytochrome [Bradyrhizobium sp.]|jgi:cytochrome c2|nr:c-type cytochrome [Bradyrhizobium sp.]
MSEKLLATWRLPFIVALATTAAIWTALPTAANAADAAAGKQLFQDKTCSACHTIGQGPLVGPDLKGVTTRRPHDWLEQWITAPDAVLGKKDEYAVKLLHEYHDVEMPNLGLSKGDVDNLLAYLATTASGGGAAESAAPAAAAAPAPKGDADAGKALFTGSVRFQNGGPPCMACHSTGGIGALGGGQLGPDLTTVATRFGGAAGVNGFIAGLPTPTMKAVWSPRPPTPEERANVVAFLAGQAGLSQRSASDVWQLFGFTVLGAVILLLIAGFRWQNRLKYGVRRPMMATPTTGNAGPYHGGWFAGPYADGWMGRFKSGEKYTLRRSKAPRRH